MHLKQIIDKAFTAKQDELGNNATEEQVNKAYPHLGRLRWLLGYEQRLGVTDNPLDIKSKQDADDMLGTLGLLADAIHDNKEQLK